MDFYTSVHLAGSKILLRGFEDGRRVQERLPIKPYLFTLNQDGDSDFVTLDGTTVSKIEFNSPFEAKNFLKRYENTVGFPVFGLTKWIYPWINDFYDGQIEFNPNLINIANIDIEVNDEDSFPNIELADKEVTAITCEIRGEYTSFACGAFDASKYDDVIYVRCKDEADLLRRFINYWIDIDPDIVTGWYIEFFDMPYLYKRIKRILGEPIAKLLSPWKNVYEKTVTIFGQEKPVIEISGVSQVDALQLYKKFTYSQQESYSLNHIAFVELGERKLNYDEYTTLHGLYKNDFPKFMRYNIKDVRLVGGILEKTNLMQQMLTIAYDAKINYQDVFGTVHPWDVIIHNYLIDRKIVVPMNKSSKRESFAGGYVKDPKLGMSKWVLSFDLTSLYPSIIMQYNISPEMIREYVPVDVDTVLSRSIQQEVSDYLKEENVAVTANGWTWDRSVQGIFPAIVEKMFNERIEYKRKMIEAKKEYEKNPSKILENKIARYDNMQKARKIQLNSLYGALGNPYFRFFDRRFAEGITLTGQLTIKWAANGINEYLNKLLKTDKDYVIASDTDSIYIELDDLVKKVGITDTKKIVAFLDKVGTEKLEPILQSIYQELADYLNVFENKMIMNRETIADKGIWVAKKRYILNVYDNEGVAYDEPKLKIMGIEAVRSSTPGSCREKIKDALKIIMTKTESDLIEFIDEFRAEFNTLPFEDIAFPSSCNNVKKYSDAASIYKKGTPLHVKGAIQYNRAIKGSKIYEPIRDGDKIKYCYLKVPNPIQDTVIAAPVMLPREFKLEPYFDRELMFQKAFLAPLTHIVSTIGWKTEEISTLEGLFDE